MKSRFLLVNIFIIAIMSGTFVSCNKKEKQEVPAINLADLNTSINPGDDFDSYANGGWKKLNPLPADRARYGSFDKLAEVAEKQVNDLVKTTAAAKNEKGSVPDKIATLFNSGMDTTKIKKQGLESVSYTHLTLPTNREV